MGDKDLFKAPKAAQMSPPRPLGPLGISGRFRTLSGGRFGGRTGRRGFFDGVLHEDSYEPLVDEHGKEIPPLDFPVAPVDP